jgi:hypothetical protein
MLPRGEVTVNTAWKAGRRATVIVAAAAIALVIASCATYDIRDDLPADAEKGWVVFVADETLPLSGSRASRRTSRSPIGIPKAGPSQ